MKAPEFESIRYLETFSKLVRKGRTILDVGCGDGRPVDEYLVRFGFAVNGIDSSAELIELSKMNVPGAFYEVKDLSDLSPSEYCVDGVVSLGAVFRTPHKSYPRTLATLASFMPNGGDILLRLAPAQGQESEEAREASASWSEHGAERNVELLEEAGFKIQLNEVAGEAAERFQIVIGLLG